MKKGARNFNSNRNSRNNINKYVLWVILIIIVIGVAVAVYNYYSEEPLFSPIYSLVKGNVISNSGCPNAPDYPCVGSVENIVDNNTATEWYPRYESLSVVIDYSRTISNSKISYAWSGDANNPTCKGKILGSLDKQNWTQLFEGNGAKDYFSFETDSDYRYLKVLVGGDLDYCGWVKIKDIKVEEIAGGGGGSSCSGNSCNGDNLLECVNGVLINRGRVAGYCGVVGGGGGGGGGNGTISNATICTDSDGGLNYYVKGVTKNSNYTNSNYINEDYCFVSGGSFKYVSEYFCGADGRILNKVYDCSTEGKVCQDGACIPTSNNTQNNTYEILSEYMYPSQGNVVTIYSSANISYYLEVRESDLSKVGKTVNFTITTPSSKQNLIFYKQTEECYSDYYYGYDEGVCYLTFNSNLKVSEKGFYYVTLSGEKQLLAYGVDKNFFSDRLVLDEQYKPYRYNSYYSEYDKTIDLSIDYEISSESGIELEMQEHENDEGAQHTIDNLLEEISGEIKLNVLNVKGNYIYMAKVDEIDDSHYNIIAAFWRSNNRAVIYLYADESISSSNTLNADDLTQALIGNQVTFEENAEFGDFPQVAQELLIAYLNKNPSSLSGEEFSCNPSWVCSINPVVCPEYGRQTKTCYDANKCQQDSTSNEVSCVPGICSGCLNDDYNNKCIPYGFRIGDYRGNLYCEIDGELHKQKTVDFEGNWASCQNNYECESNICSNGECVDIKSAIQQAKGFKAVFVKVICRVAHMFSIENYNQCVSENL